MKISLPFKRIAATLAMGAAVCCAPLSATVPPTVPAGEFACFRGLPENEIIRVAPRPHHANQLRGKKLGNSKYDNTDGHDLREVPTEGNYRILVVLVEFADKEFSQGSPDPRALVDDMLNGADFKFNGATGSANAFYRATSHGLFNPQFDVVGPVKVSKKEREYVSPSSTEYYEAEDGSQVAVYPAGRMVEEAMALIDGQVDFNDYDLDKDGMVDFVYLFFAGKGATTGGDKTSTIWPHAFTLTSAIGAPVTHDGVAINRYCTSSECGTDNKLSGIGTFCHEFGHVLGLPDLYDTANNTGSGSKCFSPGPFDCMDGGNYNNNEHTPALFSSYEQYALEWMKPTDITGAGNFMLLPLGVRPFSYRINTTSKPKEYFLLEARTNQGHDKYLPAHGLMVWHIDFDENVWNANAVNNQAAYQRIDLIEADNEKSTSSRSGDLFPGASDVCEFLQNVSPSFLDWNNRPTGYELERITRNADGTVSFRVTAASGKEMEGVELQQPAPELSGAGEDFITVSWKAVPGAVKYMACIYDAAAHDGRYITEFAPGYCFAEVTPDPESTPEKCIATFDGLEAGKEYGIIIYALSNLNASSNVGAPLHATTVGTDPMASRTNLRLYRTATGAEAIWDDVKDAGSYELAVVTRSQKPLASPAEVAAFDNSQLPDGWDGNGKYGTRTNYFASSAPSYNLDTNGAYLQTPVFDAPVASVNFWHRKRFDEESGTLHILALDACGVWRQAVTLTDIPTKGGMADVEIPVEAFALKFVYNFDVSGLDYYIDDISLHFAETVDTPVANCVIEYPERTYATIEGLQPGILYHAYVTPVDNQGNKGLRSVPVPFELSALNASGVEAVSLPSVSFTAEGLDVVPSDPNAVYSVYTADGICVAQNVCGAFTLPAPGLYLISSASGSAKLMAK